MDFMPRITAKVMGKLGNKLEGKSVLNFDYAYDLRMLDENISKMNNLLEVLKVRVQQIVWKFNLSWICLD